MLMRTDPFRELDRVTQQVFGAEARPTAMPIDADRKGDWFYVHFDLHGVRAEDIDLTVERNVLTVRAERRGATDGVQLVVAERSQGSFSRPLSLDDTLDTEKLEADYDAGVLTARLPVAATPTATGRGHRHQSAPATQRPSRTPVPLRAPN